MVVLTYLGIIVMLMALENFLVYHPVRAADDWHAPPDARVQDIEFHSADGVKLHGWWLPHDRPQGALLYCHGNAGNLSHRGEMVLAWGHHMKLSVFIFDYPGYGKSEGKPNEAACYAAADAAYDWLVEQAGIPGDRIIIYGGSLGGAVAVDLAARRPCRALVLTATFTSVPDLAQKIYPWLPARWLVRHRFDNLSKINRCTRPVFIAHGDRDSLIPISQGERLFAAANEPKRFFVLKDHDHYEGPDRAFFAALCQFLKTVEPAATN
jgi:fermentation-respiration switch protein FrsA (DUF1100 family)